jgi:two-component system, cell cycle response regulator DivK
LKDLSFLYVEDDPLSRQVINILLTKVMGFSRITIFEDSSNFIERLKQLPEVPDIALLDIQLLPYTGFEILSMIRQEPGYEAVKAIAMTASCTVPDVENLRKAGFDGLIAKPIKQKEFPDALDKILAGEQVWMVS